MKIFQNLNNNNLEPFTSKQNVIILVVAAILLASPLLYKLDEEPLKRWDESLYAIVSYDLARNGHNLLAWSDFQGQNYDEPVTKPKALFWMQAGLMKILGYDSKVAIRLPAVLFTMLLIVFIIYFCYKFFNSLLLGIFSSLVLVTIRAYMFHHTARSGDFDAFLLLFSTMALCFYYLFLKEGLQQKNYRYLYLTFASIGGAIVFKNVAIGLMFPSFLLYTLYKRKLLDILKLKQFYLGIGLVLLIIVPYFTYEALTFPNFFRELWIHEIGGRYGTVIDFNQHPFKYYFEYLLSYNHAPWILFLPLTVLLGWNMKDEKFKDFLIFSIIICGTFVLFISTSQTKIAHYIAPIYPFLGIIVGMSLYALFIGSLNISGIKNTFIRVALLGSFGLAVIFPTYLNVFQNISDYESYANDCGFHYDIYEACFKKIKQENLDKNLVVYRDSTDWWIPQLRFYKTIYNDNYGFNISISEDPAELKAGENVVICYSHMPDIENKFDYDALLKFKEIQYIKLKEKNE